MTVAYLLFGSYEYDRDEFYGAFADREVAEAKLEALRDDPDVWAHTLVIDTGDLLDGSVEKVVSVEKERDS